MLSRFEVQHYKSLYDLKVDLEPLTVFIGPNGSGKSNICEALAVLANLLSIILEGRVRPVDCQNAIGEAMQRTGNTQSIENKFWQGKTDYFRWCIVPSNLEPTVQYKEIWLKWDYQKELHLSMGQSRTSGIDTYQILNNLSRMADTETWLSQSLKKVVVYDFAPMLLSNGASSSHAGMQRSGSGIANTLADILLSDRKGFDEMESRFVRLVPNIKKIVLARQSNQNFLLELVDKYSDHRIPASDISDGTLRILAFLTAIYQNDTPDIICFEEPENGVHPWLLHKMMELLKIVSTEGVTGKPVQVLITTHSPVLLNYVEPHQVRAVELDSEGKTQVHALPVDSARFQKAMEAYDGELGELWFTGMFGGNPV
jgi:predicted ATPase